MNDQKNIVKTAVLDSKKQTELKNKLADIFTQFIDTLNGYDNQVAPHQHIKETPERMARMFAYELLEGCYSNPPRMTVFDNDNPDSLSPVVVNNIDTKSLCSHHFVPFYGKACVYYIPNKKVAGVSKFARIVNYFARRPQIQEELTKQVCTYLNDKLHPHILGVGIRARHMCMTHRGANQYNSDMETYHIIINSPDMGYKNYDIQKILEKKLENVF